MKKEKIIDAIIDEEKPFFFPRLIAYAIDFLIVSMIMICIAFVLPANDNYEKYMDEYKTAQAELIDGKITNKQYISKTKDLVYDIDYSSTLVTLSQTVVFILYFIVFQYYNNGQTFGKKLMKIKVVSTKEKELSLDQMAIHAIIANSVIIKILLIAAVLFVGREYYYYSSLGLQLLNYFVIIVALIMIIFRKDGKGLHDVLANTKVISIK